MSHRHVSARFSLAPSTVINWVRQFKTTGSVVPGKMGGHRPKSIRGDHRGWLVERCRGAAFTLRGLVRELVERGLKVAYRSGWERIVGNSAVASMFGTDGEPRD
jgi:putative transposase